jgi:hypothetical protein
MAAVDCAHGDAFSCYRHHAHNGEMQSMIKNIIGPLGQLYADPQPSPDETNFRQDNTSAQYYNSPYYLAHKSQVQAIPAPRNPHPLDLAEFIPAEIIAAIQGAGKISFHATGDTGAAKVNRSQTAATAIGHQAHVADAMAAELQKDGVNGPAFFFNLGDVIYNFGQAQYYYDQFYEPYRTYDRPIFAIPGNHDGVVFGKDSSAPQVPSLSAFLSNFCAASPGPSPDSGTLIRGVMTQPGVYFTLDAPFVSVIGLYSNVLEGPGVLSSQKGHYPIDDHQLDFLKSELARLKPLRDAHQRAIVVAVHHPPLSADRVHGGSSGVQQDLDDCCLATGLWPDLVLSGHAHLYQRFTRTAPSGKETPYIVCGAGGFSATAPAGNLPPAPIKVGDHQLEIDPIVKFGYLTVETDAKTLSVTFTIAEGQAPQIGDSVIVDLTREKLASGSAKAAAAKGAAVKPAAKAKGRAAKAERSSKARRAGAANATPRQTRSRRGGTK